MNIPDRRSKIRVPLQKLASSCSQSARIRDLSALIAFVLLTAPLICVAQKNDLRADQIQQHLRQAQSALSLNAQAGLVEESTQKIKLFRESKVLKNQAEGLYVQMNRRQKKGTGDTSVEDK